MKPVRHCVLIAAVLLATLGGLALSACAAPAPTSAPAAEAPAYEAEGAPAPAAGEVAVDVEPGALLPAGLPQEQMIIKNGEMTLLVGDTDVATDRVTQIATDSGGYVLSSQSWVVDDYKATTITITVQADQFETAMRRLRDIAIEVMTETSSGQDVSAEFVDLESRLRNLEATRDRIRTFLDQAETVEEALKVNEQLAEVEAQIEEVKGRMNYLSGRSAYSTITVHLETQQPTPTPAAWSPGRTLVSAATAQGALLRFLVNAAIWIVIVLGPYLVVGAFIVLGIRALIRRRRRKGQQQP